MTQIVPQAQEIFVTTHEAARILGVSLIRIRQLLATGRIIGYRRVHSGSSRQLISRHDCDRYAGSRDGFYIIKGANSASKDR
jgi:excisionase family DNA binding protein